MKFPENFLWGGAVTAHQSEGAYQEGGKVPADVERAAQARSARDDGQIEIFVRSGDPGAYGRYRQYGGRSPFV